MLARISLITLAVFVFTITETRQANVHPDLAFVPVWNDFKQTHKKTYSTSEEEELRFTIFAGNQRAVDEHNKEFEAGRKTFSMKMNQFGDLTNTEFRKLMNGYKRGDRTKISPKTTFRIPENFGVPNEVDWRTKGWVTPVKDQGQCGSCWSFSVTGALEGQHFWKTKQLVSLSEQNLVDCATKYGDQGCSGGWMDYAFHYIEDNKGIDTEESYPYEAADRPCRFKNNTIGATDAGYSDIPKYDETALTAAIASIGPISVAIDATQNSFQFYHEGVYYEPACNPENLDHAVLAVGYGVTDKGEKYYIVKNSWAATWGDKGYILMKRDANNHCGIATAASYPIV